MSDHKVREMKKQSDDQTPQLSGDAPWCGFCKKELTAKGGAPISFRTFNVPIGMDLDTREPVFVRMLLMFCGACKSVLAMTRISDPGPEEKPEQPSGIVAAKTIPPVPPMLDPTRKRGA